MIVGESMTEWIDTKQCLRGLNSVYECEIQAVDKTHHAKPTRQVVRRVTGLRKKQTKSENEICEEVMGE